VPEEKKRREIGGGGCAWVRRGKEAVHVKGKKSDSKTAWERTRLRSATGERLRLENHLTAEVENELGLALQVIKGRVPGPEKGEVSR